ncbi:DUF1292 domain-containing protein [Floricoccus penangensis]|uniref:UPF0473 protein BG262_01260 n=2 Tax=Floricoccus penangensis TaxID=1859475 RepID=A0A9Q5P053_9LACT|nr:DUF1292 domain-containing protein [Floricoccus penangensis]OFI47281.1 hypothetical protein BG262_01260 [Floricoccus penangensis]URZ87258.1 DUF1292 domain-containing protein [Floricoccus penangensis]
MTEHNHDHNHDDIELVTLYDENGDEVLYEVYLEIEAQKEFGKDYILLVPHELNEDDEALILPYAIEKDENGEEIIVPISEDSDAEWNMIEEVFNSIVEEEQ